MKNNNNGLSNIRSIKLGKKLVLYVFIIWAVQAVPKWSAAIMADDETSAKIIGLFITPKSEMI